MRDGPTTATWNLSGFPKSGRITPSFVERWHANEPCELCQVSNQVLSKCILHWSNGGNASISRYNETKPQIIEITVKKPRSIIQWLKLVTIFYLIYYSINNLSSIHHWINDLHYFSIFWFDLMIWGLHIVRTIHYCLVSVSLMAEKRAEPGPRPRPAEEEEEEDYMGDLSLFLPVESFSKPSIPSKKVLETTLVFFVFFSLPPRPLKP